MEVNVNICFMAVQAGALMTTRIYTFPISTARQENVSLQVAGHGWIVYCDGHGTMYLLKAEDADELDTTWTCEYECAPLGVVPSLVLAASLDDAKQRCYLLAAEPLSTATDSDATFRLSSIEVFTVPSNSSDLMDVDGGTVGWTHSATEVALVASLPSYVSLVKDHLIVLLEGTYSLSVETKAVVSVVEAEPTSNSKGSSAASPRKRPHGEDDLDDDEMRELLAKLPRAGIGFHGDIKDVKDSSDLASLDFNTPLASRFHKSSTPFSSVSDEPMVSASPAGAHGNASPRERPLEIPTAESILGGFEECDDRDPLAKAALVQLDLSEKVAREQVEIDCKEYRFLCPSAGNASSSRPRLLFRNDVHGLVYDLEVAASGALTLRHSATLPAFGFVQASKQEKKFLALDPEATFACIGEFEKRVFVYSGAATEQERASHTRKQFVVELGDQQLLGLQVVAPATILVLTARAMHTIQLPVTGSA